MSTNPFGPSQFFPDVSTADEDGFLASGGKLDPDWLLDAYTHGIFPWPVGSNFKFGRRDYQLEIPIRAYDPQAGRVVYDLYDLEQPMLWWSPDPRGIFEPKNFHVSRSLKRTIRSGKFQVTFDRCFREVMIGCATAQDRSEGTWITPLMFSAYTLLHELYIAHSVETWHQGRLVGGVYGVVINGFFAAESMFYRETDASKVALAKLLEHLADLGFTLVDIQMTTHHTRSLGGFEIPRTEYISRLHSALRKNIKWQTPDTT